MLSLPSLAVVRRSHSISVPSLAPSSTLELAIVTNTSAQLQYPSTDYPTPPSSSSPITFVPPQSPGHHAVHHIHKCEVNVIPPINCIAPMPPQTTTDPPRWPVRPIAPTSSTHYHLNPPIVYSYSFHDFPGRIHYDTAGAVPFSHPAVPFSPPVVVPVAPYTYRLQRLWSQYGDRVPQFINLSQTVSSMNEYIESIRRSGFCPNSTFSFPHHINVVQLIRERCVHHLDPHHGRIQMEHDQPFVLIDLLVSELNAKLACLSRTRFPHFLDCVMGILTGWAHHLFFGRFDQREFAQFDNWLQLMNHDKLNPHGLHLRNPFHNGLNFLEIEVLDTGSYCDP